MLTDHKPGEDEENEIRCHDPMKKYLARMVFASQRIGFGEAKKVFENGWESFHFGKTNGHWIGAMDDETLIDDMKEKGSLVKVSSQRIPFFLNLPPLLSVPTVRGWRLWECLF